MGNSSTDFGAFWWSHNLSEVDKEVARLATICNVRLLDPAQRPAAQDVLQDRLGAVTLASDPAALSVSCSDPDVAAAVVGRLADVVQIGGFSLAQPSLDEVFLALTGHSAEAGASDADLEELQA